MSRDYPKTLPEFEAVFRTEKACRAYLAGLRWPHGFRCPRCGHGRAWETGRGYFHCGRCRRDASMTAGTLFHGSHLSLRVWLRAIWWLTDQKGGVSALGLQRALGLGSYETAWACLHKLRRAMVHPGRERLTGEVEVDESFVGGHPAGGVRRRLGGGARVAVAAEVRGHGIGRIRLRQIPAASDASLVCFVRGAVAPGAVVITDGSRPYTRLTDHGFVHQPRGAYPDGPDAATLLPRVHRVVALLKRRLSGIHPGRVSRKRLGYCLDEFTFRFNRRLSPRRGMLFHRLVRQAVAVEPMPYKTLVGAGGIG